MPAGRMLKKALRQLDEGVTRLAVLSLRSFIWPVFVSIAVGSGAWMAFHQKRLGLHSQNKVPQPERMEAFWWTIAAWVGIAVSAVASVVLIGIPFLFLFLLIWFLLSVWFTVKSVLGLINLLQNRPI